MWGVLLSQEVSSARQNTTSALTLLWVCLYFKKSKFELLKLINTNLFAWLGGVRLGVMLDCSNPNQPRYIYCIFFKIIFFIYHPRIIFLHFLLHLITLTTSFVNQSGTIFFNFIHLQFLFLFWDVIVSESGARIRFIPIRKFCFMNHFF